MSIVKTTSFRVQEDEIKKFKGFAEENDLNQAEMLTVLVNAFDLARVKGKIFNRVMEERSKLKDYENSFI